ncbi:DUF2145 domain-containing protein [Pseudoduganella sp. DS3]|uniref:DUF2145 domain-containing protein n=1 Tax=Pseudoduganella guangdongensis TaxID=2692179 RepID=A0A6N9HIW6_9BURK|nr:DUF2145 domain-containing protein [Pseudoduganella guangdongensis]MYN02735.1 DUF2145 domain-containing protein [Pseudoduganella guangdongensis]
MATRTALARYLSAAWLALAAGTSSGAQAGGMMFCDRPAKVSATEQDRALRFAAVVKDELERSGATAAVVARAGLDLARFGLRYSHAGVALKSNPNSPWSVRQLYYACDDKRPRIFDQGLAGFVLGAEAAAQGHLSLVLLPAEQDAALARSALDERTPLALLAGEYSANAYAYSTRYQNCNQWLVELLASAWGGAAERTAAQAWLRARGYEAEPVNVGRLLVIAAHFVPLVHVADHPDEDLRAQTMRVSMPDAIEQFLRRQAPQARRLELCYNNSHIVIRRGWQPMGPGCAAREGDELVVFQ